MEVTTTSRALLVTGTGLIELNTTFHCLLFLLLMIAFTAGRLFVSLMNQFVLKLMAVSRPVWYVMIVRGRNWHR